VKKRRPVVDRRPKLDSVVLAACCEVSGDHRIDAQRCRHVTTRQANENEPEVDL
jgi:hypothetical protein